MTVPREVVVGDVRIGGGNPLVLIAGPCVMEGREATLELAGRLRELVDTLAIPWIFKASYDKANRGEAPSFRGPRLEEGLAILAEVRERYGVPVLTDVHDPHEAELAGRLVDVVQIPAYLSMQTPLALAAGHTRKAVNVKKGQFLSPGAMAGVARKIESTGNQRILLTERGTTFGYGDLVADFRSLPRMRALGYPVVLDPTHIIRRPGTPSSEPRGGDPEYVPHLTRAGVGAGLDALFIETHLEPEKACCDACSMLRFDYLRELLEQCLELDRAVKKWDLSVRPRRSDGFV
ncbi:MAG: 3-deoxy-8-phosphooctulonate synthase [Candidatus Riflebacteria bacterium]|nr:3-deoxy-8-phosphooctulonate synthase [Candidatus Riflebacteria bacterium]